MRPLKTRCTIHIVKNLQLWQNFQNVEFGLLIFREDLVDAQLAQRGEIGKRPKALRSIPRAVSAGKRPKTLTSGNRIPP